MRIYISADIEGVAGIASREQMSPEGKHWEEGRMLMTEETNAAIKGAYDAGATYVVVNDSHGKMHNIRPDKLDPRAELSQGYPKPLYMMEGIDDTYDLVFFVGYHAMAGTPEGVFNHSYIGRGVYNVRVNGVPMSESGLNGKLAGHFGVPVGLVTGDQNIIEQTKRLAPGIEGVVVKHGQGRASARSIAPAKARELIYEGAVRAVHAHKEGKPDRIMKEKTPVKWEIDTAYTLMADLACLVPGVTRTAGRTVTWKSKDYYEGFKTFMAVTTLFYTVA